MESESDSTFTEGTAEWSATGLENRGVPVTQDGGSIPLPSAKFNGQVLFADQVLCPGPNPLFKI